MKPSGLSNGSIVIWYPFEQENQTRNVCQGHSDQMHQLLFSPDGRFLASTDFEKKLIIWSTEVNRFTIESSSLMTKTSLSNESNTKHTARP